MIRQFSISALALLVALSSIFSLFTSLPVSATSPYDDFYHKTNTLKTNANGYYGLTCSDQDLATSWSSYILDKSKWPSSTYNADADISLQNALDHGRWMVSMGNTWGSGGYFTSVQVAWTEDASLALQWDLSGQQINTSGNNVHFIAIGVRKVVQGGSDCTPVAWGYNTSGSIPISTKKVFINSPTSPSEADAITNFFVYSDHLNIPPGYTGTDIPSSYSPKPDFYVPYILNVDDKNLTVTPKPIDTGGKCWKWASTLVRKGDSTSDNLGDWEVISETDYLTSNQPAYLKASSYGTDYGIGMLAYDCDAPAAKISDSYDLKLERVFPLKIDGSSYILDSDDLNCSNGGLCEEPSPYEDCTTYGTDIVGGIACVMRNFGVLLRSLFVTLFVPSPGFIKDYFTEFKDFITTKLGFLVWPLGWAVDFISAFFDGLDGTNNICSWSFGNLFNSDLKLNFCSLEQNFPAAFDTARYMIQAFTVFALISGLYSHYRRLIHT